jgi:hypothetical protein
VTLTRQDLAQQAAFLAAQGAYIGASSWKYPGWCGTIYHRARYEYPGKFAETRFKRECLAQYAEVFKTFCVDAAYYNFPSQQYLEGMFGQTPSQESSVPVLRPNGTRRQAPVGDDRCRGQAHPSAAGGQSEELGCGIKRQRVSRGFGGIPNALPQLDHPALVPARTGWPCRLRVSGITPEQESDILLELAEEKTENRSRH